MATTPCAPPSRHLISVAAFHRMAETEAVSCAGVIDEGGHGVEIALSRLLPPVA